MDWKDIENAVAKVSPFLGTALGGPVGGAVGALIAKGLGTSETPEAVLDALGDPKLAIQLKNIELQQSQTILQMLQSSEKGQTDTNVAETTSGSAFRANWRPAVGWSCAVAFFCNYVLIPLSTEVAFLFGHPLNVPKLDISEMMPVLLGMLGLGGMRTVEKIQGVETAA